MQYDVERGHTSMASGEAAVEDMDVRASPPSRLAGAGEYPHHRMRSLDVRLAIRSAAVLHLGGGLLLAIAALADPRAARAAIAALAVAAVAIGGGLAAVDRSGRTSLAVVYRAELAALVLIAALVACSGGSRSAYPAFYLLPVLHAAVFQPRGRLLAAGTAAVALLLAPLAYGPVDERFVVLVLLALMPAVAAAAVIHGAVRILRDERRHAAWREAEALRIADSDPVTGVGNYRLFRRALEKETARARRHDEPFSLIVLDLDGFKAINDEAGHQAGDEALCRVAGALRDALRTEDVLCRQGGDEFGILAIHAAHSEAAELARRLRAAVAGVQVPGLHHRLSTSVGWATFAPPLCSADALLAQADHELRAAKRRGSLGDRRLLGGEPAEDERQLEAFDPRLATLSSCARSFALASSEGDVVQSAVTRLIDALDATVVELWRGHPLSGQPVLAARGRRTGRAEDRAVAGPVAPGLLAQVMATNRVLVLPEPDVAAAASSREPRVTELLVPVTCGGRVLGAVRVRLDRPGSGSHDDRRLALALAAQLGIGLVAAEARSGLSGGDLAAVARYASQVGGSGSELVAQLATATGARLDLGADELAALRPAALLHRLGMVGVPAGLPLRPFGLSEPERQVIQQHPVIAEELLAAIPGTRSAADVVRHAYERQDGRGYPDGLAGERIPLASRVLHAAIAYVAMISPRPYRRAFSEPRARAELRRAVGAGQLDPDVVNAMLEVLDRGLVVPARGPAPQPAAAG